MSPIRRVWALMPLLISFLACYLHWIIWRACREKEAHWLLVKSLLYLPVFDYSAIMILSVPRDWPFFVVLIGQLTTSWYFPRLCRYPATRRRWKERDPRVLIYLSVSGLKPVYLIKGMSEELWQPQRRQSVCDLVAAPAETRSVDGIFEVLTDESLWASP